MNLADQTMQRTAEIEYPAMVKIGVLSHPAFVKDTLRRAALTRFLARLPAEVEERNEIAARYEALSNLTNDELAEIGIERDDVARVAVLGADA
jgi:uncharacterized protein YjiS (DUF1127 family)